MTYESMLAETVAFRGHNGDVGEAYYARPLGGGPWPGIVLIHHMPGWDEWIKEATRKLAHHGLATIAPHVYFREGPGSPDDVGARVRAAGGVADEQVLGDVAGSMEFLRAQLTRHCIARSCTALEAVVEVWPRQAVRGASTPFPAVTAAAGCDPESVAATTAAASKIIAQRR